MSIKQVAKQEIRKLGESTSVRGVPRALKSTDIGIRTIWTVAVFACTGILIWQIYTVVQRYLRFDSTTSYTESDDQSPKFPDLTVCNSYPMNTVDPDSWNEYAMNVQEKSYKWSTEAISKTLYERFGRNFTDDECAAIWDVLEGPSGYFSSLPVKDFGDQDTTQAPLVINCSAFGWDWMPDTSFDCLDTIKSNWNPNYYRCYTIRVPDNRRKVLRGVTVLLYLNNFNFRPVKTTSTNLGDTMASGIRLTIHRSGTQPDMNNAITIAAGAETTLTLTATHRTRLPDPWGACTDQKVLSEEENITYTSEACTDFCMQQDVLEQCGCLSPYFTFSQELFRSANNTLCGNQTLASNQFPPGITTATGTDGNELKGFADSYCLRQANLSRCRAGACDWPCGEWLYTTSVSTSGQWPHPAYQLAFYDEYIAGMSYESSFDEYTDIVNQVKEETLNQEDAIAAFQKIGSIEQNFLLVKIMFNSRNALQMIDKISMGMDGLWALLGGILSLWLGINIMTAIELVEFCYTLVRKWHQSTSEVGVVSITTGPQEVKVNAPSSDGPSKSRKHET